MFKWMVDHSWLIDDATLLVLIGLIVYLGLRLRARVRPVESSPPQRGSDKVQQLAAQLDIDSDRARALVLPPESETGTGANRTQIVGRQGRFFLCAEHVVEGNLMTRVIEVDALGRTRGDVVELERSLAQVTGELL
jgi:hypothetical protein